MVNTMDLGRGFLKLQEDNNSRRSSSLFRHKPLEFNESGLHYVTRINCGCGQCVPFRVKVERDDGGLRIGKLTLAANCHLVIVIFGFFFLIAGTVLTALAYKEPQPDPELPSHARASTSQLDSPSRQEGKVAGPIFIIVGSILIFVGFTLTILACKLNREAKRQLHLSRFTWETPIQTPDIFNNSHSNSHHHQHPTLSADQYAAYSTNNLDTFSIRSRELSTGSASSQGRRDSSFTFHRQQQNPPPPLSTIAQAVPVGVFLFGGSEQATQSPRSPTIQVTDPSGFQEIELGSPTTESAPTSAPAFSSRGDSSQYSYYNYSNGSTCGRKYRSQSDGASLENVTSSAETGDGCNRRYEEGESHLNPDDDPVGQQNKANLGLRPSLPIIPMFATSPHYFSRVVTPLDARSLYVTSRSDEPFGSIASLSTSGDIACFPVTSSVSSNERGGTGVAQSGNINIKSAPEQEAITSPGMEGTRMCDDGSANNNANIKNANLLNRNDVADRRINNDVNNDLINTSSSSSISGAKNGKGISELPPINVYEFGNKSTPAGDSSNHGPGVAIGFTPKSILRKKSEDCMEASGENTDKP